MYLQQDLFAFTLLLLKSFLMVVVGHTHSILMKMESLFGICSVFCSPTFYFLLREHPTNDIENIMASRNENICTPENIRVQAS